MTRLGTLRLRVRRPAGRQRVQMLVAYGVRAGGSRQLLGFLRSRGESQAAWEGFLNHLYARGLTGHHLLLMVTDGCAGLAAAIQTVYPRVKHQRCWVHKMRNILEKVRKRDYDQVKAGERALWTKLRTTNAIERCFVEVRRRTRPMVCFVNVESLDRIIYAILNGYNEQHDWRNRTLQLLTQAA